MALSDTNCDVDETPSVTRSGRSGAPVQTTGMGTEAQRGAVTDALTSVLECVTRTRPEPVTGLLILIINPIAEHGRVKPKL